MRKVTRPAAARGAAAVMMTAAAASGALALAGSVSLVGLSAGPAVAAADGPSAQALVNLDLRDAKFEQAIALLMAKKPDAQVVFTPTEGKAYQPVNLKLVDQPFDKALRLIAQAGGAVLTEDEGIYYVRPRGADDPAPGTLNRAAATPTAVAPAPAAPEVREPRQLVTIRLTYAKPSDIKRVLANPDALSMIEDDESQRNAVGINFVPADGGPLAHAGTPAFNPNATPFKAVPPQPQGEEKAAGTAGVAGQNDPSFAAAGQRGIGGFGAGAGGGFQGGGFQGGGAPGGIGGPGGGAGGRNLTPAGVDNIISNDADNTLIVQGDAAGIEELRQIVRLLDVAPKQVIIRAEFVRVDLNDADGFGIDWTFRPTANSDLATAVFGSGNSITGVFAAGNAVANLRATLTRSTSNILQAPIISTSNNRTATINVASVVPIQQSITTITPQGQQITSNNITYIPANNSLSITPHINGDNSVSLFVAPQLTTTSPSSIPNAPTFSTQFLTTYRRIANGESMVLGGFITKQDNYATNNVPLLSKLPIIGNLFRSYDHTVTSSEVLIFLTPQIIEDRAQGVVGTAGAAPAPTP